MESRIVSTAQNKRSFDVERGEHLVYLLGKRLLDIVLSAISLIALFPFFIIIIIAIRLDSKGPIFFKQKRFGKNRQLFTIYKFRTMHVDTPKDAPTHLLLNPHQFITRIGRILRLTSLDELPQLWNILIGDMSVVGPRPALWNQEDLMTERDKYQGVHELRPGLTGLAQINGRDQLSVAQKAAYDGEYARKMSLLFDCRCIYLTIFKVIQREGVIEGAKNSSKSADHQHK